MYFHNNWNGCCLVCQYIHFEISSETTYWDTWGHVLSADTGYLPFFVKDSSYQMYNLTCKYPKRPHVIWGQEIVLWRFEWQCEFKFRSNRHFIKIGHVSKIDQVNWPVGLIWQSRSPLYLHDPLLHSSVWESLAYRWHNTGLGQLHYWLSPSISYQARTKRYDWTIVINVVCSWTESRQQWRLT